MMFKIIISIAVIYAIFKCENLDLKLVKLKRGLKEKFAKIDKDV